MSDYCPTTNLAGGYHIAIDTIRTGYEAAKVERPDLSAEAYIKEVGGSYFLQKGV